MGTLNGFELWPTGRIACTCRATPGPICELGTANGGTWVKVSFELKASSANAPRAGESSKVARAKMPARFVSGTPEWYTLMFSVQLLLPAKSSTRSAGQLANGWRAKVPKGVVPGRRRYVPGF